MQFVATHSTGKGCRRDVQLDTVSLHTVPYPHQDTWLKSCKQKSTSPTQKRRHGC